MKKVGLSLRMCYSQRPYAKSQITNGSGLSLHYTVTIKVPRTVHRFELIGLSSPFKRVYGAGEFVNITDKIIKPYNYNE